MQRNRLSRSSTTEMENLTLGNVESLTSSKPDSIPEPEDSLTLWAAVRRWPKVVGYCLALTTTIILWGYDFSLVGAVGGMPVFL